jgi:hypothetical protein
MKTDQNGGETSLSVSVVYTFYTRNRMGFKIVGNENRNEINWCAKTK